MSKVYIALFGIGLVILIYVIFKIFAEVCMGGEDEGVNGN